MTARVAALPVAYRDVRAADLALRLGLPTQPALAVRTLALGGWSVVLRILAASHQVFVSRNSEVVCSETVACPDDSATHPEPLPRRCSRRLATASYELSSAVERTEPPAFGRRVDDLLDGLGDHPHALCATYPGDDHAATALRAQLDPHGSASWSSWHCYPQTSEVVVTESRLAPRAMFEVDR